MTNVWFAATVLCIAGGCLLYYMECTVARIAKKAMMFEQTAERIKSALTSLDTSVINLRKVI